MANSMGGNKEWSNIIVYYSVYKQNNIFIIKWQLLIFSTAFRIVRNNLSNETLSIEINIGPKFRNLRFGVLIKNEWNAYTCSSLPHLHNQHPPH